MPAARSAWRCSFITALPMVTAARVPCPNDSMSGALLGPEFCDSDIGAYLDQVGAVSTLVPRDEMICQTARLLAAGKVIGWFQGRMEFGPRALGARSILGDPRSTEMQSIMNLKIKMSRELPAVRAERVARTGRRVFRPWMPIRRTCCSSRRSGRIARCR